MLAQNAFFRGKALFHTLYLNSGLSLEWCHFQCLIKQFKCISSKTHFNYQLDTIISIKNIHSVREIIFKLSFWMKVALNVISPLKENLKVFFIYSFFLCLILKNSTMHWLIHNLDLVLRSTQYARWLSVSFCCQVMWKMKGMMVQWFKTCDAMPWIKIIL